MSDTLGLGTIKLSKLKKFVQNLEAHYKKIDKELSAQFLIPSLFPQLWKNFQENIKSYYTKGYIAGQNDKYKNFNNSKVLEIKDLSSKINEMLNDIKEEIKNQEQTEYSNLSDEEIANEITIEDNLLKWIDDGIFLVNKINEEVLEES